MTGIPPCVSGSTLSAGRGPRAEQMRHQHPRPHSEGLDDITDHYEELQLTPVLVQPHSLILGNELDAPAASETRRYVARCTGAPSVTSIDMTIVERRISAERFAPYR